MANKKRTVAGSAFVRALSRFSDKLAKKAGKSFIAKLFSGYFAVEKKAAGSFAASVVERRGPVSSSVSALRDSVCRVFSENRFKKKLTSFLFDLLYIRTRDIGIYLFSTGLYAVIEYFIIKYAVIRADLGLNVLIGGAALMAVSTLFLSGRSFVDTVIKNPALSFIVFDLIGADRGRLKPGEVRMKNASIALLLGMVSGALAFLIPPYAIILAIVCVIVLCTVFSLPESGAVLMLVTVPFLPLSEVLTLCFVTTLSYLLKTVRKKRELRFGPIDLAAMLLAALTLFGKLVTVGSSSGGDSLYLLGIAGYFVCRNLLCKREWIDRAMHAAALSSAAVSWFGILFYFCGTPSQMLTAKTLLAGGTGEMSVFFGSSAALACYIIMTSPLLLYFALESKHGKAAYFLSYAASLTALALTGRIYAFAALIVASLVFLTVYSRRTVVVSALLLPAAALAAAFLPAWIYSMIFEKLYSENALIGSVWRGTFSMISDHPFGGTGIGSFSSVYPLYALPGYEGQRSAKSVYLQLFSEGGVMMTVVFVLFLLLFLMFCVTAIVKCGRTGSKQYVFAPLTAVFAAILYGFTEDLFSSQVICILTFSVIGCGAAASELCRREYDYKLSAVESQEDQQ
ncbi:MAG: O-antigen ligase family protein [Clostridia bacterium]|nr:O-antigen ligase family protein [Clostridia bacterium]